VSCHSSTQSRRPGLRGSDRSGRSKWLRRQARERSGCRLEWAGGGHRRRTPI